MLTIKFWLLTNGKLERFDLWQVASLNLPLHVTSHFLIISHPFNYGAVVTGAKIEA